MTDKDSGIRLNKYLAEAGLCSRREADRMIEAGRVAVDGTAAVCGMRVSGKEKLLVDGCPVGPLHSRLIIAFNKPAGLICTSEIRKGTQNIYEYLQYPERIFSVGRLDKDSEGLLLLTNDGSTADRIMRSRCEHEKEYEVTTDREVTEAFLQKMRGGVPILEVVTKPCKAVKTGRNSFRITLTQGLNRQIRRMCAEFGYTVMKLRRIRIMNIELGSLPRGEYRALTEDELRSLDELLRRE